ncbi:MAG: hypothetical protein V7K21_22070 [Nostoc sp.]|uniref:hypothetical protein n=1 Tax=Nostoc sp. TaxID=1180 RepID=UPI002FF5C0A6
MLGIQINKTKKPFFTPYSLLSLLKVALSDYNLTITFIAIWRFPSELPRLFLRLFVHVQVGEHLQHIHLNWILDWDLSWLLALFHRKSSYMQPKHPIGMIGLGCGEENLSHLDK